MPRTSGATGEEDGKGIDDPLQLRRGGVQAANDGGQRDVEDRVVEADEQKRDAQDGERGPGAAPREIAGVWALASPRSDRSLIIPMLWSGRSDRWRFGPRCQRGAVIRSCASWAGAPGPRYILRPYALTAAPLRPSEQVGSRASLVWNGLRSHPLRTGRRCRPRNSRSRAAPPRCAAPTRVPASAVGAGLGEPDRSPDDMGAGTGGAGTSTRSM